jgi:hypothetical protein
LAALPFFSNVDGELDGKMLAGGWLETVIPFCESPQAFAAALQNQLTPSGGGIAGSDYPASGKNSTKDRKDDCSGVFNIRTSLKRAGPVTTTLHPKAVGNMAWTFFRYYIP